MVGHRLTPGARAMVHTGPGWEQGDHARSVGTVRVADPGHARHHPSGGYVMAGKHECPDAWADWRRSMRGVYVTIMQVTTGVGIHAATVWVYYSVTH